MYQKVGHHIAECKITPWVKNVEYIPVLKREGFDVDLQSNGKMVINWDKNRGEYGCSN